MTKSAAQGLLDLLKAIDTDHPKDFIDLVCFARDSLPQDIENQLSEVLSAGK